MQKIISWNVASVRARLPVLTAFLAQERPDFVFLQEIKATEDTFPFMDLNLSGYTAVISGQKGFNGVAILSRTPLSNIVTTLPGLDATDSEQARFIQAETTNGTVLISVYVPNGNPPEKDPTDTSRLAYKRRWMAALTAHMDTLLKSGRRVILGGDFNVIERDDDVYNPAAYRSSALMVPPVRADFETLQALPITNVTRRFCPEPHTYSFWDFQMGAWPKNWGMLLDFIFVSDTMADAVQNACVYKEVRGQPKTSDHAPIGCIFNN